MKFIMKKNKYSRIVFLLVISFLVIGFVVSIFKYSHALYVENTEFDNYSVSSSAMYISSNMFTEESFTYQNYINMASYDGNNIPFKVYNYNSNSQISKKNIIYNISCTVVGGNSNYTCYIDNTSGAKNNITLSANGNNKVVNNHNVSVKKNNGNYIAQTVYVQLTLTTTSPYKKNLYAMFKMDYDPSVIGVKIVNWHSGTFRCDYVIENYGDTASIVLNTVSNSVVFVDNSSTTKTITVEQYGRQKVSVYKNGYSTCSGAISIGS